MMDFMRQFIHDMIHMTEGEKFIYYWPLWLCIGLPGAILYFLASRQKGRF